MIKYPNVPSAMRPVPHLADLSVSKPPAHKDLIPLSYEQLHSKENSAKSVSSEDSISVYSGTRSSEPHWITQEDLNYLQRDKLILILYLSSSHSSWHPDLSSETWSRQM